MSLRMKVRKLEIPPILRKLFPLMQVKDYQQAKREPLFTSYTVRICEDCYINVCTGTSAGGVRLRTATPNYSKHAFQYSKSGNVSLP